MANYYTHYAMFGIDISDYRDKIIAKEEELDEIDGLPGWSHNEELDIGYNFARDCCEDKDRNFFGMILDEATEHGNDFSRSFDLYLLIRSKREIIEKWKEFLETYFPKDLVPDNLECEIKFISVYN